MSKREARTHREQIAACCVHFTGIQHEVCKAGVNYRTLIGGPDIGWAARLPCHNDAFWKAKAEKLGGMVECGSGRWPTAEEVEAEATEHEARIKEFLAAIARGDCPRCKKPVKQRQVGNCVYGDCGHRLYQGKVQAMTEGRPAGPSRQG